MNKINYRLILYVAACVSPCISGCREKSEAAPNSAAKNVDSENTRKATSPEVNGRQKENSTPDENFASNSEIADLSSRAETRQLSKAERLDAISKFREDDSETSTKALVSLITTSMEEGRMGSRMSGSTAYPAIAELKKRGTKALPHLLNRLVRLIQTEGDATEIRLLCMTALLIEPSDAVINRVGQMNASQDWPPEVIKKTKSLINSFGASANRESK